MTDSMIERVARALCSLEELPENAMLEGKPMWMDFIPEARTAVAAMREPTHIILQAGFNAEVSANPYKTQPHHVVPAVWNAMIDAVLAEDVRV